MSPNPAILTWPRPSGAAMDVDYLTYATDETDRSAYTFAGLSLGGAAATRYIIVGYYARAGGSRNITSLTVGGVTATLVSLTSFAQDVAGFAIAAVPTGASGDVVVTLSGEMLRCAVALWRVLGQPAVVDSDTTTGTAAALSRTLDATPGGHLLALMAAVNLTSGSVTWTGADERFDAYASPLGASGADLATNLTEATVSADYSAGSSIAERLIALTIERA